MEYAIEAIKLGSTAIGIQTSEGVRRCFYGLCTYLATVFSEVILAVEKRITSPLMEPTSIGMSPAQHKANLHYFSYFHSPEKIVEIDSHIACAFSGLTADSKTLIDRFHFVI